MIAKTEQEPLIILPPGEKKPEPIMRSFQYVWEFTHNDYLWLAKYDTNTEEISLYLVKEQQFSNTVSQSLIVRVAKDNPITQGLTESSSIDDIAKFLISHYAKEKYLES